MAASVMARGLVDLVIVGTDRVTANGDVVNKIGTLGVAVLARHFGIPFYVACPSSTIDLATATGSQVEIEERTPEEVTGFGGARTAPHDIAVANPAFDVTPHGLVTGIITEHGVIAAPFEDGLRQVAHTALNSS
jgi:methylthioribose-1-phosphate isomerase